MRPHVELVDEKDLIWHMAELPHGEGDARQRNLNYDEEDGAASLLVEFQSDWSRGPGLHAAQTEWYVLEGQITIGDTELGEGGYWCAPRGVSTRAACIREGRHPRFSCSANTRIGAFDTRRRGRRSDIDPRRCDRHSDSRCHGLVRCGRPGTRQPDGFRTRRHAGTRTLHQAAMARSRRTGFYTRLIKAKPGWREHPLAHHPVLRRGVLPRRRFRLQLRHHDERTVLLPPSRRSPR